MTRPPRPAAPARRLATLALLAGAAAGLHTALPAMADEEARPLPDMLWQLAMLSGPSRVADDDDPAADDPAPGAGDAAPAAPGAPAAAQFDERGRRIQPDEPTVLAFKNVPVETVVPFIVEATGKVVLPQPDVLSRRITILNDQPIPRSKALDLVVLALQQNGIAVVEHPDRVVLRDIAEIDRQDVPVLSARESVLKRTDLGSIVEKVFQPQHASVANLQDMLKGTLPTFAKMSIEPDSNQLVVMGNIALLQRIERLVNSLDQPAAASLSTETFLLRYADANQIATNIRDLYSQNAGGQNNQNRQQNPFNQFFGNRGGPGGGNQGGGGNNNNQNRNQGARGASDVQISANLRVTPNTAQNSVTVLAEKAVLEEIRRQVTEIWDKPLQRDQVVPRVFELKYTDPVKMRDTLTAIFGNPGASATTGQQRPQGQNNQTDAPANRAYGQFTFEAIPDAGRIAVIAKSAENMAIIADVIDQIDRPQTAGLPRIVELKHASAEELAEQLNALLAREGTLASVTRAAQGLTTSASSASPFATQNTTASTNNNQNQNNQNNQNATGSYQFWWQRSQPPTNTAGTSNLVSKIRIVPVWRQNSLMILSPPEYRDSLSEIIDQLDRPGRQVLLSAVIAEINVEDALDLGLRWSNSAITPTNQDNAISLGANQQGTTAGGVVTGTKNNLLPGLFDTSVLNVGVNLNVLFQALSQKTAINILSEPRIFTSDNQEAEFFNGQDIPFITDSTTNTNGNLVQSFDYRAVGIALRARPRITVNRDVDLNINLELSSIQPNQTLFGGFIVDRRESTTHVIVRDGQTVVVSGILRTEDSDIVRKFPGLGDIPLLGNLFKSVEKSKKKIELVAFITPIVVNNPEEARTVNEPDLEHLKELKRELRPAENLDKTIRPSDPEGKNAPPPPPPPSSAPPDPNDYR